MYKIIASTYGPVEFDTYDTKHHSGPLLSGSNAFISSTGYGELLIQEYTTDKFTIHYNEFYLNQKTRLLINIETRLAQADAVIKTKLQQNILGYKTTIKEGQFSIAPGLIEQTEIMLDSSKKCQQFSVGYQLSFIEELIPYFPFLEQVAKAKKADSFLSIAKPRWLSAEMESIINQVLDCQYEPALRDFFFDDKVGDLLFLMLVEVSKQKNDYKYLSKADIDKVHAARSIILNDLTNHLNISQLARKVELNEFKLKTGFKQLFGAGPFTLLKNARMHKAYDLILNTDKPIKDIQFIAGYASLTSFVGAFKKFFGKTPGDIRYR